MNKKKEVGNLQVGMYGIGNFAAQLSWTMVSTYLAIFYTDVFGLAPASVALLMLIAKIWDGINDPIMGVIMEKNNSRFGKYRPFIVVGTIILVVFTILTFTVPNFGSTGKLIWAYVTYIFLGMSYTMENVPFNALPSRMTKNPNRINQLFSASMMGGAFGGMVLMSITLPIVMALGQGNQAVGYQRTATVYAIVAVIINLVVVYFCKENVETEITSRQKVNSKELFMAVLKNRNLILLLIYTLILMIAVMGRVGVMVYFYMYCVETPALMGILMIIPNITGLLLMPFCPVLMRHFGKKKVAIAGALIGSIGLAMMFFGPYTNILWMILSSIVFGCYSIGSPCGGGLIIDAVDDYEKKNGIRTEGLAFSLSGLMNKIGGGIGSAAGVAVIGLFGYSQGVEMTDTVLKGINVGANLMPVVMMLIAIVPLCFFDAKEINSLSDDCLNSVSAKENV